MAYQIDVPEAYRYMVDRVAFEYERSVSNLSFLLENNLHNPEIIDSELFTKLERRAQEKSLQKGIYLSRQFLKQAFL